MNPNELHASHSAGSSPREEKVAVVRSSVVRTVEGVGFDEVEAVEFPTCEVSAGGEGERLAFDWELDATDPASESDIPRKARRGRGRELIPTLKRVLAE